MSETKFGIGEWKMRNGRKAVIIGILPRNPEFPWIGYRYLLDGSTYPDNWSNRGLNHASAESMTDLISPWTYPIASLSSTIAPGHNPDKLTVEQVGEGWWLPEWEVLEQVSPALKIKHFEVWFDGKWWNAPFRKDTGPENSSTYRTRLPREELLKLIAPKKRLIRVEELPPFIHVMTRSTTYPRSLLVVGRDHEALIIDGRWYLIINLHKEGFQWSSDLKTWNSFEVEDKQ